MAKLTNPLFSISATGSLSKTLNYQMQAGQPIARKWHKPLALVSPSQLTQRDKYITAVANWILLSQLEKAAFEPLARYKRITPFNAYLSIQLQPEPPLLGTIWDAGLTTWDSNTTLWDI